MEMVAVNVTEDQAEGRGEGTVLSAVLDESRQT